MSFYSPVEITEGTSAGTLDSILRGIPRETLVVIRGRMPRGAIEGMHGEIPCGATKRISGGILADIPGGIPRAISKAIIVKKPWANHRRRNCQRTFWRNS